MALSTPFPEGFRGIGPLGNESGASPFDPATAAGMFELAISLSIGIMTVVAGIWFTFQILSASIEWLSAGGDKQHLQNAQKKIVNSILGLFIVVASYGIIIALGNLVGFDAILAPATIIINSLHP